MSDQIVRLSRQQLYDLVWSEAVTKVAARYALSDVGLRKICVKHRIPLPPRGYWQKVQAGAKVHRIALPAVRDTGQIVLRLAPNAAESDGGPSIFQPAIDDEAAFPAIVVAPELERPQAATKALKAALKDKPDSDNVVRSSVSTTFLTRVHRTSIDRVLGIADALAKACEARGFELRPGKEGARYGGQLAIVVDEFAFDISFTERLCREAYRPTPAELERRRKGQYVYTPAYQFTPSGMLSLTLAPVWGSGLQGTWTDTKARMIELRLGEVMLGLRKVTIWRRADQAKEAARQARFDAEQRKRAALRASVDAEKVRIERLEADAGAWRRAENIRDYAAARAAGGDLRSDTDLKQWLAWATDQADRIDPLRQTPSSILDTPEGDMTPLSIWNFPHE